MAIVVSLVARSLWAASGGHRLSFRACEEAVILLRTADGDAQAALEALPAGAIADQDRALQEGLPDVIGVPLRGPEQDEVGVRGPAVHGQLPERGRHPATLLGDPGDPRLHLGDVAQGQQPSQLRLHREVVGQDDRLAGLDHGRVCHQVPQAGSRQGPRLGEGPGDDQAGLGWPRNVSARPGRTGHRPRRR